MSSMREQKRTATSWLIMLGLVFMLVGFSTRSAQAQRIGNEQPTVTKVIDQNDPGAVNATPNGSTTQTGVEQLPYYNYKGITDLEAAKELWIQENPDAYARLLEEQKTKQMPAKAAPPAK